jgi:hypothetical protein
VRYLHPGDGKCQFATECSGPKRYVAAWQAEDKDVSMTTSGCVRDILFRSRFGRIIPDGPTCYGEKAGLNSEPSTSSWKADFGNELPTGICLANPRVDDGSIEGC